MSEQLVREVIGDGIHFSSVTDRKFKHNYISLYFLLPLDQATASDNAVVPYILRKGCRECPDFTTLQARLASLYGAYLDAGVGKYNGYQTLEVSIKGLDNRFALEKEDVTGQCAKLLASIALDPNLDEKGLFNAKDVELERQFVLDTIESEINDKRSYALSQCVQTMCAGEPVAVRRYGYPETASKITPESATAAYRHMLESAPVEIIFAGSGDPSAAKDIFSAAFGRVERKAQPFSLITLKPVAEKVREKTETMDLSQGKMVLGLRCGEIATQEEADAMRVCSAVLGGTPFSKLFLNVREKLSLCYYCSSRFDVSTGLLFVDSGVEAANKQKAQDEILRQLEAVRQGEITDEELVNTKLLLSNAITSTNDSLSSLSGWHMAQTLRGRSVTPEQDVENINKITREQVVAAAKKITLDTVYFLTGMEDAKEAAQ